MSSAAAQLMTPGITLCLLPLMVFALTGTSFGKEGSNEQTAAGAPAPDRSAILQGAVRAIVTPSVYIATSAVHGAMLDAKAFGLAKTRLSRQMAAGCPQREAPEPALVRVWMMLALRMNTLLLKTPLGSRIYPGPEAFNSFAQRGWAELARYCGRLNKKHSWTIVDTRACEGILLRELKKGVSELPVFRGQGSVKAPPHTPEEEEFFAAVREKQDQAQ